uniref:Uncharacterized protein n=1 Tax=Mucochytrium quahogii TaxID=96639 RepID=A0A7S2RQP8_9STRA|mmetsp:Transcript_18684/g.40460  ORF Transcript_18684/g.40460 Transcript_18684/m.40460 type:complete len:375 (+) Transcript_18684:175-1299(+)
MKLVLVAGLVASLGAVGDGCPTGLGTVQAIAKGTTKATVLGCKDLAGVAMSKDVTKKYEECEKMTSVVEMMGCYSEKFMALPGATAAVQKCLDAECAVPEVRQFVSDASTCSEPVSTWLPKFGATLCPNELVKNNSGECLVFNACDGETIDICTSTVSTVFSKLMTSDMANRCAGISNAPAPPSDPKCPGATQVVDVAMELFQNKKLINKLMAVQNNLERCGKSPSCAMSEGNSTRTFMAHLCANDKFNALYTDFVSDKCATPTVTYIEQLLNDVCSVLDGDLKKTCESALNKQIKGVMETLNRVCETDLFKPLCNIPVNALTTTMDLADFGCGSAYIEALAEEVRKSEGRGSSAPGQMVQHAMALALAFMFFN